MTSGRIKGRGFKILAAAIGATVLGVGSVLHASADTIVSTGAAESGIVVDVECQQQHCIEVDVQFDGVANNNDLIENFACIARAYPDSSATGFAECRLENKDTTNQFNAVSVNPPGPMTVAASADDHYTLGVGGGLQVCFSANAIFTENLTGPELVQTKNDTGQELCVAPPGVV